MTKPTNPIPNIGTIAIAKDAGARWIRFDCKHWILSHFVWKIFRVVDGSKQQAFIGYGEVIWREEDGRDWEIGLLGERPMDSAEVR